MNGFQEYELYDALGMAELVRRGEVRASELVEAAIARIERLNVRLNAVVTPMFELARERVRGDLGDGPLRGVPMLLKDELAPYAGVRHTRGSKAYRDRVASTSSELVRRYEAAGLVVVGKANTPEFALAAVTEPELHGPTRNPWDLERSPGGSSGGSAAAVAAGMVPVASGNDMGGSIRIPSSWCGLFGLKPSRGRNPTGPVEGEIWLGLGSEHVLTRSVRDSAAVLDASCGFDAGAPYYLPLPQRPFLEEIDEPPTGLRIAFTSSSPLGTEVDLECVGAVREAARLLEELGHSVDEATPPIDGWAAANAWLTVCFSEVAAELDRLPAVLGRRPRASDVEPVTWTMGLLGRAYTAAELNGALGFLNQTARAMGRFHERYDVYLTPTTAVPPVRVGELQPKPLERALLGAVNTFGAGRLLKRSGIVDQMVEDSLSRVPFTQLANMTGQPSATLPFHWTADGLPCGVMVTAPIGDEATVLRLAAQVEEARPWNDRRPDLQELA
jgi:amidase